MSLGFAFALLLTLQSLQLVSTQPSTVLNLELTPPPVNEIPNEWQRENDPVTPEERLGISSSSMTFSGEGEYQADNQTETEFSVITGHYDANENSTPSFPTTLSSTPPETDTIQQNNMSNPDTPNIYLEPSNTNSSLEETNTTTSSPENFTTTTTTTTPVLNVTESSTSTESENLTTTSPPPVTNGTSSSENSTSTTVFTVTTTTQNDTSVYETSIASTTNINATGGSLNARENVDRGLSSDVQQKSKSQAWGAILGIGVAVAIVAMVVYIIVKRRNYRHFSHKKLVEDLPPGPVLRLDNSEPLDFKFDGAAYYNPGLQGDNIQMTNFPQGQTH